MSDIEADQTTQPGRELYKSTAYMSRHQVERQAFKHRTAINTLCRDPTVGALQVQRIKTAQGFFEDSTGLRILELNETSQIQLLQYFQAMV